MTTVLSPSGVELPDGGDPHSRAQVNRNFTKINDLWNLELKASQGLNSEVEATSNSGSITAIAVVMNIPSFTFKANRWYEVAWYTAVSGSAAGTAALAQIHSCSTADAANLTTGLTELMEYNLIFTGNHTVRGEVKRRIKYGSDTTLQIKATLNGNGLTLVNVAGATFPSQLLITDLGQNF